MTRTRNNNLSLSNVYEDKAKYVHKMGGGVGEGRRKAVCIQAVKVQVLCSTLKMQERSDL